LIDYAHTLELIASAGFVGDAGLRVALARHTRDLRTGRCRGRRA
jgi:hypothetical protein